MSSFGQELKDQLDYILSQQNLLKEKAELAATVDKNMKEAYSGLDALKRTIDVDMVIPPEGEATAKRLILPANSKSP